MFPQCSYVKEKRNVKKICLMISKLQPSEKNIYLERPAVNQRNTQ